MNRRVITASLPDEPANRLDVVRDEASPKAPDPLYYLKNFEFLLTHVLNLFDDLLSDAEKRYAHGFFALPEPARCLYARLAGRKGPLFRTDKIAYREVPGLDEAVSALETAGLMARHPARPGSDGQVLGETAGPDALLGLLLTHELRSLLDAARIARPGQARRNELHELALSSVPREFIEATVGGAFGVIEPLRLETLSVFRLCFFGNLRQDLTEFVTTFLGVVRYEKTVIEPGDRFFTTREELDSALALHGLKLEALTAAEAGLLDTAAVSGLLTRVPGGAGNPVTSARRDRFVNRMARELERLGEPGLALRAYNMAGDPPARERRARILARLGRPLEALRICEEALASPLSEEELEFAGSFGRRLARALGTGWPEVPPPPAPVIETVVLPANAGDLNETSAEPAIEAGARAAREADAWAAIEAGARATREADAWAVCEADAWAAKVEGPVVRARPGVEELAARWLRSTNGGGVVVHVENSLFTGLFGLIFRDIVFMPLKGAFCNPFQSGPSDLWLPSFRQTRRGAIEARLEEVRAGAGPEIAMEAWDASQGIMNALINWKILDRGLVELALQRIPGNHLAPIFDRMTFDLKANTSGLPDLIKFPVSGGYELIEVKGPGDRLQANQKRWFAHFSVWGVPARVLKVEYQDLSASKGKE